MFVFTCRTVWIKCCLLPTHVQMRSCRSSSVLRKGILIWLSNHMGKSHTGSNVASSSILCSSLLSEIHSNSLQWLIQVCAVHTCSLKGCTNSPLVYCTNQDLYSLHGVINFHRCPQQNPSEQSENWISEHEH